MTTNLCGGDDPALGLDGPGAQKGFPVGGAGADGKGRRVEEHLGRRAGPGAVGTGLGESEGRSGEAEVKANEASDAADGAGERFRESVTRLDGGGFAKRAIVKEMNLIVRGAVVDAAVGVDPEGAVEELGYGFWRAAAGGGWDRDGDRSVDTDANGNTVLFGCSLYAADEGGFGLWLGEGERLFRA